MRAISSLVRMGPSESLVCEIEPPFSARWSMQACLEPLLCDAVEAGRRLGGTAQSCLTKSVADGRHAAQSVR